VFQSFKEKGTKWSEIAKIMEGRQDRSLIVRTDNSIKNMFYSRIRKELKRVNYQLQKYKQFKSAETFITIHRYPHKTVHDIFPLGIL
jgi:transposase-like protein